MRTDLTRIQVETVMRTLHDAFEDDERAKLDTLEGETDLFDIVGRLLEGIENDEGDMATLAAQMEARKVRKDRAAVRVKARRAAIADLMAVAEVAKLSLPEATLSVRQTEAKLVVNDPTAVPDQYTVSKPVPSMALIGAAFTPDTPNLPNWLRVEDARLSLTVRRK